MATIAIYLTGVGGRGGGGGERGGNEGRLSVGVLQILESPFSVVPKPIFATKVTKLTKASFYSISKLLFAIYKIDKIDTLLHRSKLKDTVYRIISQTLHEFCEFWQN